jgi:hypothetical protein
MDRNGIHHSIVSDERRRSVRATHQRHNRKNSQEDGGRQPRSVI